MTAEKPVRRIAGGARSRGAGAVIEGYSDSELVRLPLDQVGDRLAGDTRALNPGQVEQLHDSIAELGLIQPLAVDSRGRLLAGGHRRAALHLLAERAPDRFDELFAEGIPCRRFAFDSAAEPERSLAVEISENEKRRNYTREEIRSVAERLRSRGYSQARGRGNRQPLIPALATAFGVHRNTVLRALTNSEPSNAPAGAFEAEPTARRVGGVMLPADLANRLEAVASARGCSPATVVSDVVVAWLRQQ